MGELMSPALAPSVVSEIVGKHRSRLARGETVLIMLSPYMYECEPLYADLAAMQRCGLRLVCVLFDEIPFPRMRALPGGANADPSSCRPGMPGNMPPNWADPAMVTAQSVAARLRAAGIASHIVSGAIEIEDLALDDLIASSPFRASSP